MTAELREQIAQLRHQADRLYQEGKAEQTRAIATILYGLAESRETTGDYSQAEILYCQALEIDRKVLGEKHPDYATGLNNLALLYSKGSSYAKAERLYLQAMKIYRATLGEDHPYLAESLNNLAGLYESTGDYAKARELYRKALAITCAAVGEEDPAYSTRLNNLAYLYESMGSYDKATPLYRKALVLRRKSLAEEHPDVADSLNNLAGVYQVVGNYVEAEPLYRQALAVRRKALGEKHPSVAQSLNNLATLCRAMGKYSEARMLYSQVLAIRRATLGENDRQYAVSSSNLAGLHMATGDYAKAEPLYRRALKTLRSAWGEEHPQVAGSLNNLASLCAATHREVEAMTLMREATAVEDRILKQIFSMGSESQRMAYLRLLRGSFEAFLSLVAAHLHDSAAARRAGLELVLRRKAIGIEALAAQRVAVLEGSHPELKPKLQEWSTLRAQIARKTLDGPGPEGLGAHQQLLAEWDAKRELLEEELARQIPEVNLEKRLREAKRQAVAGGLPRGAALVEYVRFDVFDFVAVPARGEAEWKPARYLAFVLPAREPDHVHMIDLGEAQPIDRMIASFRASITGEAVRGGSGSEEPTPIEAEHVSVRSDRSVLREALIVATRHVRPEPSAEGDNDGAGNSGAALREVLFDPLVPVLGGRQRLFLAPDGDLARLPFEVLPTDDGRHLIDEYKISYVSVGRDVLRFGAESSGQPGPPIVAADPDFDLGSTAGRRSSNGEALFERLRGTRAEGERISALLRAEPLLGARALETNVKGSRSPSILHLATHGFFLPDALRDPSKEQLALESVERAGVGLLGRLAQAENPLLRSGLALAGANTWLAGGELPEEAEDGLLTAEDVTGMDLLATELVVLSACETGLGEVHIGEGVYGLRRAIVLAGAKTLVMSLWQVPDRQTQELMEDFYRHLLQDRPRAEALRAAQLAIKERYPDPLYWGAFVCQGDPSTLLPYNLGE